VNIVQAITRNAKVDPKMPPLPQSPKPSTPAALAWLDEFETMKQDNAFLREEVNRLGNALKVANETNKLLKDDLVDLKNAHYRVLRHDMVMAGGVEQIVILASALLESARAESFAPPGSGVDPAAERTAEAQKQIDDAAAQLAQKLAPEQPQEQANA
jgi:hypothetical protein